jgi:hypothetical protein
MEVYTTDAGILCLVAIDAIKKRAIAAGVDPADSTVPQKAASAPVWIWIHVTGRAKAGPGRTKGVGTSIEVSQQADLWASGFHRCFLHLPSSGSTVWISPPVQEAAPRGVDAVGADVWTNLANALAMHAASKGATTTVAKKGFEAFPITSQQMILFASERDEAG